MENLPFLLKRFDRLENGEISIELKFSVKTIENLILDVECISEAIESAFDSSSFTSPLCSHSHPNQMYIFVPSY